VYNVLGVNTFRFMRFFARRVVCFWYGRFQLFTIHRVQSKAEEHEAGAKPLTGQHRVAE